MVRVAQWCECTSCHRNVQLNMVKTVCVILCDFYHNEKKIFFKHPNSSTYPWSFFLEFAYEKTLTEQAETTTSPSGPFCSFLDPPPLCLIVSLHPKLPFQFSFHQKSPSNPAFSKLTTSVGPTSSPPLCFSLKLLLRVHLTQTPFLQHPHSGLLFLWLSHPF